MFSADPVPVPRAGTGGPLTARQQSSARTWRLLTLISADIGASTGIEQAVSFGSFAALRRRPADGLVCSHGEIRLVALKA